MRKDESHASFWQLDRVEAMTVERNRYFVILLVTIAVVAMQAIAFMLLLPLKETKPYLLEVDRVSQLATVIEPLNREKLKQNKLLRTYFLNRYVEARMSKSVELFDYYQTLVRAMSATKVYKHFQAEGSPDARFNINTEIITQNYPYSDTMEVRFFTELINNASGKITEKTYWLATLHYLYADATMSLKDREQYNPLGLFVTDFKMKKIKKEIVQ